MNPFRRGLVAAILLLGLTLPAHAQRGRVAAALLQYEAAVTWEAVTPDWRRIRPGWLQQVGSAVQRSWRGRRAGWVAEAQSARSPGEVARLLLELEAVTLWSAVDGSWRNTRPGWVAELSAVAGRAGRSTK
jgi:hypothetical protein